jgi:hypothetical protein
MSLSGGMTAPAASADRVSALLGQTQTPLLQVWPPGQAWQATPCRPHCVAVPAKATARRKSARAYNEQPWSVKYAGSGQGARQTRWFPFESVQHI